MLLVHVSTDKVMQHRSCAIWLLGCLCATGEPVHGCMLLALLITYQCLHVLADVLKSNVCWASTQYAMMLLLQH